MELRQKVNGAIAPDNLERVGPVAPLVIVPMKSKNRATVRPLKIGITGSDVFNC